MDEELIKTVSGNRHSFERKWLSEYAYQSRRAQRMSDEPGHYAGAEPDYRSPFAHDTDRIIHSHSYARYMDKTQVFFQIKNDHITRRSLHEDLFEVYLEDLEQANSGSSIFVDFIAHLGDTYLCANTNERIVVDFIAGMTDQYFLKQHEMRFMPRRIDYDEINIIKNMGW